jgi:hypothetical protein
VIHHIRLLAKRFATCLSVVAALSFAADAALGTNHHMSAAAGHHHHGDSHSHGAHSHVHRHHAPASDVQAAHDEISQADTAAGDLDGALSSSLDNDGCGFLNACFAAVVLPCPRTHSVPCLFYTTIRAAQPRPGKGVEPDGLRRPPRPLTLT